MARSLPLLLLLVACGREVPRDSLAARRAERASKATVTPDTAVFVARQAGDPAETVSAVMQLHVTARNAEIAVENPAGQQAMTGALGGDALEEIPGSRSVSVAADADATASAGWRASVNVPVLEGERYLLELAPSTPRRDTAIVELGADGTRLGRTAVEMDASDGEPALFEVVVGARTVTVSPRIARLDLVPTCGTTHVVRSSGRADLFAQYQVMETHEMGDVHIPPRADDAQFRSVSFHTRTRGTVSITYLGRELANAARPEACPES